MRMNRIYTVVLDFGSDKIKAAVAELFADGSYKIRDKEESPAGDSIRRGVIFNLEETAKKVKEILGALGQRLGQEIDSVYPCINGRSLHTHKYEVELTFPTLHEITAEDVERIKGMLKEYEDEAYTSLMEVEPTFFVNGSQTSNPIGVPATSFKAHSQIVLARPQLILYLREVLVKKLGLKVHTPLIAPLALADFFLKDEQKVIGSALIDFGAECTSVAVYHKGKVAGLRVIPLGGNNITQDLFTLLKSSSEAERIKCNDASVLPKFATDATVIVRSPDARSSKEYTLSTVNQFVVARVQDIVANIQHYIQKVLGDYPLSGGVVITGGASRLRGLDKLVADSLHTTVERTENLWDSENTFYLRSPEWNLIYSAFSQTSESCTKKPEEQIEKPTAKVLELTPEEEYPEDSIEREITETIPDEEEQMETPQKSRTTPKESKEEKSSGKKGFLHSMISLFGPNDPETL